MLTANEILKLLTGLLTSNSGARYRIRSDYEKYKLQMSNTDARQLASVKYLRSLIADKNPYKW
jgi:hypothetical protein